ncbi:enoyl-CoA hydratase-related protein [Oceanibacterium hippocampi]|uniref:2,3-dehydroadipyl-CoA hydratase n=1 Tax=Oceanibacterium hippocampi TaxID=745714 RepID=A0A1Y5SJ74_9PROT|nr:enoyl-CoA hydratase-related protein [Oceanibacterium hippocampi]SLN41924.1 2,3-dehydroadipyl-CoA hydratase [Oceanibacterium hippocampi]
MSESLLVERRGPIAILTLNLPDERNILSGAGMIDGIVDALAAIGDDHEIRVAVLTGAGPAFSAGGDIKKMVATAASPDVLGKHTSYMQGIQRIPRAFANCDVPIIAAVNGPATGAGLDLACMCDIRIAGEKARFAESFIRLGILPGDGGAWFLPRVVGLPKAIEMTLTGDWLSAEEALECGLVTKLVPQDELMATALAQAERIARHSGPALRMTKSLLRRSLSIELEDMLRQVASLQAIAHSTPEHKEAVDRAVAALGESRKAG